MEGIQPPKTMRVYQLIKLNAANGLNFGVTGGIPAGSANYIGTGFYTHCKKQSIIAHWKYSKIPVVVWHHFTSLNLNFLTRHIENDKRLRKWCTAGAWL